jgi:hypothetical protein
MDPDINLASVEWATPEKGSDAPYYNIAMQALRKVFLDHGVDESIQESWVCSPLGYSLGQKTIDPKKNHLCNVDRLESATCVNCFFSSTRTARTGAVVQKLGSMRVVKEGSTWDILLDSLGTPLGGGKWMALVGTKKVERPATLLPLKICFKEYLEGVPTQVYLAPSRNVVDTAYISEEWYEWIRPGPRSCLLQSSTSTHGSCHRSSTQHHHLPYYGLCLCRTQKI